VISLNTHSWQKAKSVIKNTKHDAVITK